MMKRGVEQQAVHSIVSSTFHQGGKMKHPVRFQAQALLGVLLFHSLMLPAAPARGAELPRKDSQLPAFQLPVTPAEIDQQYLGVKPPVFALKDVQAQVLLVEILGVYCPLCYQQAPLFNKLYGRIQKKSLGDRVKMLGIAIGATATEVEHLRKSGSYEYPIVRDESFVVHKLLGEPRTPFTMLISKDGKVLYTHLGVIEDMDAFFQLIQDLARQ
jgi:peroxiredoxin